MTIKHRIIFAALCISSLSVAMQQEDAILKSLSKERYFPYQDILVNNATLWHGLGPDCPSRYEAIQAALQKRYKRPITVLDIGASNGYFSLKLAERFNAQCVMVDMSDRLKDICTLNTRYADDLIYLKKALTASDLAAMKKRVHFDVAVVLHVLHHLPDWKEFKHELHDIADTVIIETPPANDLRLPKKTAIPAIEEELLKEHGEIICETSRTMPGFYDNLKEMQYGIDLMVPTIPSIKSKMFIFDDGAANESFQPIDAQQLAPFNIVFPHN